MATHDPPPPPPLSGRSKVAGAKWGPTKMTRRDPPPITWPGRGKRGVTRHFSNSSIIKDYFKTLISHNRRAMLALSLLQCQSLPISFPCCSVKVRLSPFYKLWREKMCLILWPEPIKYPHFSVGYTTFYRQHLCRRQCTQEQSWPQQHMWNSKLFVLFPAKYTAAYSLHFQHLYVDWGYRFKMPIVKEPFVSNVHVNILMNISL